MAKDGSTSLQNNHFRILLYSHDGLGAGFFGTNADNLHTNANARKRVEEVAATLTKFNVYVDAVVERRNGFYFIKDTKFAF